MIHDFARTSAALEGEDFGASELRSFGAQGGHSGLSDTLMRSTPERAALSGRLPYGHNNKKGSKVHAAVDTLGHLLVLSA